MNPSATTHFLKWNFIQLNDDCGQKHERRSRLGFFPKSVNKLCMVSYIRMIGLNGITQLFDENFTEHNGFYIFQLYTYIEMKTKLTKK